MLTMGLRESFKAKEFSQDKISVQEFFYYSRKEVISTVQRELKGSLSSI